METILVTPSWPSRPNIQDISIDNVLFCHKADGQHGIRLSAFFCLSAFSANQPFKIHSSSGNTLTLLETTVVEFSEDIF